MGSHLEPIELMNENKTRLLFDAVLKRVHLGDEI